ncbi:MAG: type IV pilus modification PilV family protein, partial [Terrimicrobiaceae bacterium]
MNAPRTTQGMSLLIVLAFIVIISVLVVGFSESMRLLRPASASHLERARADQFAWSGIERVIATLNQQTADTNRNWATQPGQLITGSLTNDPSTTVDERKVLSQVVPLHSGTAVSTADPVLAPPNLNVVTYRDPTSHLLTEKLDASGNATTMQVAWIYVRQSGATDTNAAPVISANDPIVGRYAYWTDDESSKINYNIAWGRAGNTNAPGHPTRI